MQVGFVVNPRRSPRAPARCRAAVVSGAGVLQAETEDVGAQGCQLVGAHLLRSGERVLLEISNELVTGALRVGGRIAWASGAAGGRAGVAYEVPAFPRAREWFERLVASHPGVGAFRRVPERIAGDAMVFLGSAPAGPTEFSPEELMLLRCVGDGIEVRELIAAAGPRWVSAQRPFFSLLQRQFLTLLGRHAMPATAGAPVLAQPERPDSAEPSAPIF